MPVQVRLSVLCELFLVHLPKRVTAEQVPSAHTAFKGWERLKSLKIDCWNAATCYCLQNCVI